MQRLLLFLLVVFFSGWMGAEVQTQRSSLVLDLEYRSSEQVISGLRPHLQNEVRVTGQGQRLLVSGPSEQLAGIADLVTALDQPEVEYRLVFAQGRVDPEERQASTGRRYSTASSELLSLHLTAGVPARLERGFWVPVSTTAAWGDQTGYQWMAGGVWVMAEVRGDEVVLAFSSRSLERDSQASQPPAFSGAEVESRIRLQPGHWRTLASEGQQGFSGADSTRRFSTQKTTYYYSVCVENPSAEQQCPTF